MAAPRNAIVSRPGVRRFDHCHKKKSRCRSFM
jgi:hypothetical protein